MTTFSASTASLSPSLVPSIATDVKRHTVNFSPSIWGGQFLTHDEVQPEDLVKEKQVIEDLKEAVRKELMITSSNVLIHKKLIELIDAVQRLGVAYHFEEEIEEALKHIYVTYGEKWTNQNNLQSISLWFRLLRQQGFNVSSVRVVCLGIFKDHLDKGNFKESLCEDAQVMLALYEASYMRVEGEKVLDDALEFTKTHLAIIAKDPSCDSLLRTQIQQALKQPLRKRLPRLEAVHYIPIYQQEASHNEALLKLAKLDFNLLQSIQKEELMQLCKWWKDLDMQQKLPYVRDRLIEGYFWILGVYYEPHHSRTRMFLMKTSMWLIVLDDTYDNYGTYEELKIFTNAVERWSMSCIDTLPEYMKLIYQELLSHHQEMEEELKKEGKAYQIPYVIEMAKDIIRNNLLEAKWLKEGYMPTLEEYISVSVKTCTYGVMIARAFVGRSDNLVSEDTLNWVATYPPIVKAACLVLRLMDDITTHKEEQERGHVASSIECYQNENGATEKEACEFISKKVEDAWKVINRDSLRPTEISFPLLTPIINYARACDLLYKVNDGYTHAKEEIINHIKSLLVHPLRT